jgi:hypothetical protein
VTDRGGQHAANKRADPATRPKIILQNQAAATFNQIHCRR